MAIGAALLGAEVIAVEDDLEAISIAEANAQDLGCNIRFIRADITDSETPDLIPEVDTVIMNPPSEHRMNMLTGPLLTWHCLREI